MMTSSSLALFTLSLLASLAATASVPHDTHADREADGAYAGRHHDAGDKEFVDVSKK